MEILKDFITTAAGAFFVIIMLVAWINGMIDYFKKLKEPSTSAHVGNIEKNNLCITDLNRDKISPVMEFLDEKQREEIRLAIKEKEEIITKKEEEAKELLAARTKIEEDSSLIHFDLERAKKDISGKMEMFKLSEEKKSYALEQVRYQKTDGIRESLEKDLAVSLLEKELEELVSLRRNFLEVGARDIVRDRVVDRDFDRLIDKPCICHFLDEKLPYWVGGPLGKPLNWGAYSGSIRVMTVEAEKHLMSGSKLKRASCWSCKGTYLSFDYDDEGNII